jgi:hypothetical protein
MEDHYCYSYKNHVEINTVKTIYDNSTMIWQPYLKEEIFFPFLSFRFCFIARHYFHGLFSQNCIDHFWVLQYQIVPSWTIMEYSKVRRDQPDDEVLEVHKIKLIVKI